MPKSVTTLGINSVLKSEPPSIAAPSGISAGLTNKFSKSCKPS